MGRVTTLGRSSSRTIYCSEKKNNTAHADRLQPNIDQQSKPQTKQQPTARGGLSALRQRCLPPPIRRVSRHYRSSPLPSRLCSHVSPPTADGSLHRPPTAPPRYEQAAAFTRRKTQAAYRGGRDPGRRLSLSLHRRLRGPRAGGRGTRGCCPGRQASVEARSSSFVRRVRKRRVPTRLMSSLHLEPTLLIVS